MDGTSKHGPSKPISLLVFAMGGEGGGVLTGWIVAAARAEGFAVQATSVPGVAQRTGGTTYYIEMAALDAQGRAPVFALTPVVGQIDVILASELAEAARAAKLGYATPERTALIASSHRVFLMPEKMAMSDGRLDPAALEGTARSRSREAAFLDMEALAQAYSVPISPVMLGALAGAAALPISRQSFERAIREGRVAVDRNLAAFAAAFERIASPEPSTPKPQAERSAADFIAPDPRPTDPRTAHFPEHAREVVTRGLQRLADYQDETYAALYLKRLEPFRQGDADLLREIARQLALRMSYEDVIRVAQHKARAQRYDRIRGELGIAGDEPFEVQDYFKPGAHELADIMPPIIARFLLRRVEKGGRLANTHVGMKLRTTTVLGYLRVWLLAKLKRFRRRTWRYQTEQVQIESWLSHIRFAARTGHVGLAREITELARLIKGYGDTHRRGLANYGRISRAILGPALDARTPPPATAALIKAAREAALADPEGTALDGLLAQLETPSATALGPSTLAVRSA